VPPVMGLRAGAAAGGDSRSRQAMRRALTAAQCAGAAALVVLAMMLTRSFVRLTSVDPGWTASGVLTLTASPRTPRELRRPWYWYVQWSDRLIERLEATPGIRRAAVTTLIPLSPRSFPSTLGRGRGKAGGDQVRWPGLRHSVTDGYFQAMDIRLLEGRAFGPEDRFTEAQMTGAAERERGVAVVSATTARTLWPDRPAIGQALWLPDIDTVAWREVVGVVEDMQFHAMGETPALHVFVPWTQTSTGNPRLLVKTDGTASATAAVVRDVVQSVEPGTYVDDVIPLDALVSRAVAQPRFTSRMVAAFGMLALVLSAVGIYGTLSYIVGARTREIGIRLALGASRWTVMWTVVTRSLVPAIVGGAAGLVAAWALARTFRALFFQIEALDVMSLAGGTIVLLVVALAAAVVPARRAASVDPAVALRSE
jgi:putative ABC transport system permease protein